jgi:2,3-bisphosphoglycerate-independent phosphoglycerate mutase
MWCINFNYRADRARQITRVLARNSGLTADGGADLPKAAELDLEIPRNWCRRTALRLHDAVRQELQAAHRDSAESMDNLLAHLMAQANLRNLRVAETEKYAHVTYFFNGGIEKPFAGEDRALVPSQKVATYDLAPEMSAAGIADAVVKAVADTAFDVIIVNFANADMVGHSGKLEPTIKRGGDGGPRAGADLSGGEAARRRAAGDRRPRQRGDADRSRSPAARTPRTPPTRCRSSGHGRARLPDR